MGYIQCLELKQSLAEARSIALAQAHDLYSNTTQYSQRWILEAYLLAGETNECIANVLNLPLMIVEAYQSTFFDISPVLGKVELYNSFIFDSCTKLAEDLEAKRMVVDLGLEAYLYHYHQKALSTESLADVEKRSLISNNSMKLLAVAGYGQLTKSQIEAELLMLKERQVKATEKRTELGDTESYWEEEAVYMERIKELDLSNVKKRAGDAVVKLQKSQALEPHAAAISMISQKINRGEV